MASQFNIHACAELMTVTVHPDNDTLNWLETYYLQKRYIIV